MYVCARNRYNFEAWRIWCCIDNQLMFAVLLIDFMTCLSQYTHVVPLLKRDLNVDLSGCIFIFCCFGVIIMILRLVIDFSWHVFHNAHTAVPCMNSMLKHELIVEHDSYWIISIIKCCSPSFRYHFQLALPIVCVAAPFTNLKLFDWFNFRIDLSWHQ